MRILALVFFGGGLGSLLRYLVHRFFLWVGFANFPYATFIVNIVGCFFIGFFVLYTERYANQGAQWRLFLVTGLCGGFTTFSAFSFENVQLINDQRVFLFLAYTIGSVALGIIATYCGLWAARSV